jgi:methylation protein EvaC
MKCKITGKKIVPFMSFGKMPIANGFLNKKDFNKEFFFDLKVGFSDKFSLFQLDEFPSIKKMFHKNYPFYTSSSKFMIEHFKNYARWSKKFLKSKSKIIELGSNDGTFLKNFNNTSIDAIGFEPSKNVSDLAKKKGVKSINKFFNTTNISDLKNFKGNTDLICGANVVCHVPDLKNLFISIDRLLTKDGVFVFEEPYLGSVYEKNSYDQIYDEHIYLFSAVAISKIAAEFDLKVIDLLPQPTHGGSMRYVLCRKSSGRAKTARTEKLISYEKKINLDNSEFCKKFKKNCEVSKKNLKKKILELKNKEKKICGYAATSKSTTILNYCNIGPDLIDFISDTTPEKIGKYSPGSHIPIIDHKLFLKNKPDVAILFAWNHSKEIMNKEKKFKKSGGKWLTFFPNVKVR